MAVRIDCPDDEVRVVARDVLAGALQHAVAGVREPLPVVAVCAPYFACETLASLLRLAPSFATQSIVGIVTIACAPALFVLEMKLSPRSPGVALASPMLSKYQSAPRLSAFCCQL